MVIVDLNMPRMGGIQMMKAITDGFPRGELL
jgi:YesN/AraC family two-component response regulator